MKPVSILTIKNIKLHQTNERAYRIRNHKTQKPMDKFPKVSGEIELDYFLIFPAELPDC